MVRRTVETYIRNHGASEYTMWQNAEFLKANVKYFCHWSLNGLEDHILWGQPGRLVSAGTALIPALFATLLLLQPSIFHYQHTYVG